MEVKIKNLDETKLLAECFADNIKEKGAFVSLFGDIGAGKTAFTRFLLKNLGVIEDVTSPSFVILNEYKTKFFPIYHFDLYRLENEGVKSIKDELLAYSEDKVLTLVEWANFGEGELPIDKIEINIKYDLENYSQERVFEMNAKGEYFENVVLKTVEEFNKKRNKNWNF